MFVTPGGKIDVPFRGRLVFFLEGMQDIDGFSHPGVIDHAISAGFVRNPKLFDTLPYDQHRLEVVGPAAALDLVKLIAGILANVARKVADTFERSAKERNRLHDLNYVSFDIVFKLYILAGCVPARDY